MNKHSIVCLFFVLLVLQLVAASSSGNNNRKFTLASEVTESDWSNIDEMKRAWNAAIVRIPKSKGGYSSHTMSDVTEESVTSLPSLPTIIYLHGCSGVWNGTYARLNFLATAGFVVIAPVSFARKKYPQSCDPLITTGSMYRGTLNMRKNDAAYAIANAKQLSWVDGNNMFLMGHSEGGVTTATFKSIDDATSVNARVIEGWTCHAGWAEYRGINASAKEPVLALVAKGDPWFQNKWTRGDCSTYLNKSNGSRSIVLSEGALKARHALLEDKHLQKIVLEFLHQHIH